ncbi:MAG: transglycosylase domain-containing protein [Verrucomicrobiales bacterium]
MPTSSRPGRIPEASPPPSGLDGGRSTPTGAPSVSKRGFSLGRGLVVAGLAVLLLGISAYWLLPWLVPLPAPLAEAGPAAGGHGISTVGHSAPSSRPRTPPRDAELIDALPNRPPPNLEKALLAAQDPDFWHHGGTDVGRVAGNLVDSVGHGRLVSGGSTITEQLAKMSANRASPRTIAHRVADALVARRLEMSWSKERILAEYVARLPFGNDYTGITAAAAGYFGKPPADLTLAECALLVGLPDAPNRLNPYRHFEAAKAKQKVLLDRLAASGQITADEARQAADEPMRLRPGP